MFNGNKLKQLRNGKKLTQKELGEVLGVTKSSICCYEKGTRTPTLENLLDISKFFGIKVETLFDNDNNIIEQTFKGKKYKMNLSDEEIAFIKKLRRNKLVANAVLEDPNKFIKLVKKDIKK